MKFSKKTLRRGLQYTAMVLFVLTLITPQFIATIDAQEPKYFFKITNLLRPPPRSEMIDLMKEEFAKIGIDYDCEIVESAVFSGHQKQAYFYGKTYEEGGADMTVSKNGWQRLEPGVGYGFYFYSGFKARYMKGSEHAVQCRWYNPRFDKLFETMNTETDFEKRKMMVSEMGEIVEDELPKFILWFEIHAIPTIAELTDFEPIWGGLIEYYRSLAFAKIKGKTEADDVTFIMAQSSKIDYASPFWATGVLNSPFINLAYDMLVDLDQTTKPIPALAKSWDISEDGLKYTFYLHDDVYWHDGTKFTSEDVKWSLETYMHPDIKYMYANIAKFPVKSMETPDDYTLVINLEKPHIPLLARLAYLPIQSKQLWEGVEVKDMMGHENAMEPCGTGPFKVVNWEREEYIELASNDNWYGGCPFIDHLVIKFIPESSTALSALETGEVHMLQWYYTSDIMGELDRIDEDPRFQVFKYPSGATEVFTINNENPNLDDYYVRKAINHIIPREHICEDILMGYGEPAGQLFPSTHWAYNPNIKPAEYNVTLAREYMEKAGYNFELLEPQEIPKSTDYTPLLAVGIVGFGVGSGLTYGFLRKRKI